MSPPLDAQLTQRIADALPSLVEIRRDLHAHPQTAFEETHASGVVQTELERLGVPFLPDIATTGVVGWITPECADAAKRPAIGLRADMDALPITEETGLPYASKNPGVMHACGHDGHTTILLGAARVLSSMRDQLPRPVRLVFQPAEEVGGGAAKMIDGGALSAEPDGAEVACMFGMHGWPDAELGAFQTRGGTLFASTDWITLTITGRSGHAAAPHKTADPIVAAAQVITSLQTIVSRNVRPSEAAVLTITTLRGGSTFNIIPESVEITGTIRTISAETQSLIHGRVREVATQVAAAHDCRADVRIDDGYPQTINDEAFAAEVIEQAKSALGPNRVSEMNHPAMVAEDFAFYGRQVPSCFALLGLRPKDRETYPGLHTPRFDFNDAAIPTGVRMMCQVALA